MDVELRCEAEKCVFNLERICTASEILVRGEDTMGGRFTYCSTFSLDDDREASLKYLNNDNNYNVFITSPEVECTAINCEYNQGEMCYAPHVKIVSAVATAPIQTECQTFIPREGLYSSDVKYALNDVQDDLKHEYDQTYSLE
ncbi:MAG: DUF1540 domain-containing protein [Desulfitobacteriia bacterium]|jgi:hypothetical protein